MTRERLSSARTLGRSESNNGKSAVFLEPLVQSSICRQCGSSRAWKSGFYKNHQRWLCRDCGYRFSVSGGSERVQKVASMSLNCVAAYSSNRQVCVSEAEGTKNLAEEATRQETAAGAKTQTADPKGKLVEFAWWMKKEAYSEATIIGRTKLLRILTKRGANLYDTETIKTTIAKQSWSVGRKANAVDAYSSFLEMTGGEWKPPLYKRVDKIPFIPTENEVDQLIAGCSKRMGTFLQLLKETGIRSGEAWALKWTEADTISKTVRIAPEKNSNPRIFHTSPKLSAMFEAMPRTYGDRVFANAQQPLDHHRDNFTQQRKRIACKLKNPRLMQITFHTLRHWKGTMEYHRTRDPFHVMSILGHKNIKNTLKYIHLSEELFKDQQEYVSKVAKTEADACVLIEAGFEFICDFNGTKIFRKPKY